MKALLDANFLIALFDAAHVHHTAAQAWLIRHRKLGWATCPLTENGCVRILSQPTYPGSLPLPEIGRRLSLATAAADHEFWPDDLSICDRTCFDLQRIAGSRMLTDAYLLALAVAHRGRLVTFDQSIPIAAVKGAQSRHLLIL